MTITTEQLDELERLARATETSGPWRWDSEGDALETAVGRATVLGAAPCGHQNSYIYGSEGDKAHIAANSPDVTLRLVAIARVAMAVRRQLLDIRSTAMIELAHANMVAGLSKALDGEP